MSKRFGISVLLLACAALIACESESMAGHHRRGGRRGGCGGGGCGSVCSTGCDTGGCNTGCATGCETAAPAVDAAPAPPAAPMPTPDAKAMNPAPQATQVVTVATAPNNGTTYFARSPRRGWFRR